MSALLGGLIIAALIGFVYAAVVVVHHRERSEQLRDAWVQAERHCELLLGELEQARTDAARWEALTRHAGGDVAGFEQAGDDAIRLNAQDTLRRNGPLQAWQIRLFREQLAALPEAPEAGA